MNFDFMGLIVTRLVSYMNILQLLTGPGAPQKLLQDEYWGLGKRLINSDENIRPFEIVFDKQLTDDLKMRLNSTRTLQSPLENVGWSYGISGDFVSTLGNYWLDKYDFQRRKKHLNQYPHFITNIQGLDIHFIHVKPKLPDNCEIEVLPLYIQHSWPGSVVDFFRIIPMLTSVHPDRDFVFEVIAPSLPGFGYSSAPAKAGLGPVKIAQVMKNLMLRLGFAKWYVQGGDLSGMIVANMAAMYPEHVLGIHSHLCLVPHPLSYFKLGNDNQLEISEYLKKTDRLRTQMNLLNFIKLIQESGYFHIQATKPETIGVAMSDSPLGLAAYILEKFATATRADLFGQGDEKNMLKKLSMDELLDNVMLYWAPNKATTSFRLYAEILSLKNLMSQTNYARIEVPSACAQFPLDSNHPQEVVLRDRFLNLVSLTEMPRGGHFVALLEPQLLVDDIFSAVKKMRDQRQARNIRPSRVGRACGPSSKGRA